MNKAINVTLEICPQFNAASKYLDGIYNNLTFNDSAQLAFVACEASRLQALSNVIYLTIKQIYTVGFFVGTVGAILALCSYALIKQFNAPAFYYYRAINVFDLSYMIYFMIFGFDLLRYGSIALMAFELAIMSLMRITSKSSRLLVLWLAFDRSIACRWPVYYRKISNKKIALRVIFVCFLLSFAYEMPNLYYDVLMYYFGGASKLEAPLAILKHVTRAIEGLLMLFFMPIVIVGFIQMSQRKRNLINAGDENTVSGKARLREISHNRWLCVLQMCESVPFILSTIIIYISYITNFSGVTRSSDYYLVNTTYEANVNYQNLYRIQKYFTLLVECFDVYGHCGHFYNYLICSPKFRSTLISFIKHKFSNQISGTSTEVPLQAPALKLPNIIQ